ncbi:MAG: hypothetical protein QHH06_05905 [Clostridiales bacterium]|nr:hypothetical protein [Eubacteriales bacterium]MDH7565998.1 hypothetical protein [Clostridiales bacterium]
MARTIPEKLSYFLKNGIKDVDDGYEYASELNRILNSDDCQMSLTGKEIEALRDYADAVKKIGEITYYSEERIKEIEREHFGSRGIWGFLGMTGEAKPQWPF